MPRHCACGNQCAGIRGVSCGLFQSARYHGMPDIVDGSRSRQPTSTVEPREYRTGSALYCGAKDRVDRRNEGETVVTVVTPNSKPCTIR